MRLLPLPVLAGLALAASACGGSNPGSGTKTLYVKAAVQSDGTSDGTWLAVEVREGSDQGVLVTDAQVSVRGDSTGETGIPWGGGVSMDGFNGGVYVVWHPQWDRGFTLNVNRGSDHLNAYVETPGITTITSPISGTAFALAEGKPLVVEWKDSYGRRAENVRVDLKKSDYVWTGTDDTLRNEIDPNRMVVDNGERVRVTRTNQINLAGGAAGSTFEASTTHAIDFVVE